MRHKLFISVCFSAFLIVSPLSANAYDAELNALLLESSNLLQSGRVEEALVLLKSGESKYVESREFMNNLAVAYLGNSEPDIALSILRQLVDNDPMYSIIAHNLLEMELQITDNASEKISPVLFIQTVESFFNEELAEVETAAPEIIETIPADEILPPISSTDNGLLVAPNPFVIAEDLVLEWAQHWSAKNYSDYISMYSTNFSGPNRENYSQWASVRRDRLNKPGPIQVDITNVQVEQIDEQEMLVNFDQGYTSANYSDRVRKQLTLYYEDSNWKIARETTLATY